MKLKTRICKKNSIRNSEKVEESSKSTTNCPLSCVDWSSNEEIYFVR